MSRHVLDPENPHKLRHREVCFAFDLDARLEFDIVGLCDPELHPGGIDDDGQCEYKNKEMSFSVIVPNQEIRSDEAKNVSCRDNLADAGVCG